MSVSDNEFKQALSMWASGVTVVTSQSQQYGLQGMTVTGFSSVSMQPPQVLVCLNKNADTLNSLQASSTFGVNVLSLQQESASNQFAGGSTQTQRFLDHAWHAADNGAPLLKGSLVCLACRVVEKVSAGSHWVIIGEIEHIECGEGSPLLYYRGAYRQLNQ